MVKRLPITTTMIYLLVGIALGPYWLGVLVVDPLEHADWLHHGAEVTVIISLFTIGLKLRLPPNDPALRPALCLALISMIFTVGLIAVAGVWMLGLPLGAAILLGAVLAPTDPVLASDVQIQHPHDRDKVRLTLSAEAGLNDGTAFPFVMLGLGLLQLHEIGTGGWRWFMVDILWAGLGGLAIGGALGYGVGRVILRLQRSRGNRVAFGEYLVIGLIGLAYGVAIQLHTYGFLAVFAAGLGLRAVERKASAAESTRASENRNQAGTGAAAGHDDPRVGPAYLAGTLLSTNEQLEHILEVALVLVVGAALATAGFAVEALWFAPLLFVVIRPLSATPILLTGTFARFEFGSIAWFGIRGIGSLYYIMYAVEKGLPDELAERLISLVLTVVTFSIVAHGISATPLFDFRRRREASP